MDPTGPLLPDAPPDIRTRDRIRDSLLPWYMEHRRAMPWRRNPTPYAVWVSEIMLQQTQVQTVIPYYERWMRRFPTIAALAQAPLAEVLHCWAGLGYYARARNLHAAARAVVRQYGGILPADQKALQGLPGVGRYTAGAILSIAFGVPAPILDANAIRVFSRLFLIEGDPSKGNAHRRLWQIAEALVSLERPGDFNQAIMELGAMVCTPEAPLCATCPVASFCRARADGRTAEFPQTPKKRQTVEVEHVSVVIHQEDRVLLVQRHPDGLWGGLWELPRVTRNPEESLADCACRAAIEITGVSVLPGDHLGTIRHTVTHHRIALHAVDALLSNGAPSTIGCADWRWVNPEDGKQLPLPAPQTRLLHLLQRRRHEP